MEKAGAAIFIGILALMAIVAIVMIVVGTVLAVGGLALTVTALMASSMGGYKGLVNWWAVQQDAHAEARKRLPSTVKPLLIARYYEPQNADLLYFFDKGWYVIKYVTRNVWGPTSTSAQQWFDKARDLWNDMNYKENTAYKIWWGSAAAGAYFGAWVYYVAAFAIVAVFVLVQATLLIAGALAASVAILLLSAGVALYSRIHRIYFRCPDCHFQMPLPVHTCPNCGERHTKLWPSVYGIFSHVCRGNGGSCYAKLPTLSFRGRKSLDAYCPRCNYLLQGVGSGTNIHIPVVGGRGTGKSHYIAMAVMQLIEEFGPAHGLRIDLPNQDHKRDYDYNVQLLKTGKKLAKTSNTKESASAFNLEIKYSRFRVPKLLYLYDAAGEYFGTQQDALQQSYFQYLNGILFIVDPFSIEQVHKYYENELATTKNEIAPSNEGLESVFENVMTVLEDRFSLRRGRKHSHPVAVVVTKTDAFDLEQRIGDPAAANLMMRDPTITNMNSALSKVVEEFLIDNGASNFVRNLRAQFENVRFFSCSSVGLSGVGDHSKKFAGVRVLTSLLWLLGSVDAIPMHTEEAVASVT